MNTLERHEYINNRIQYLDNGYSYIPLNVNDIYKLKALGSWLICDNCNNDMGDDCYLVFILGRVLCSECFQKWSNQCKKSYKEDIHIQQTNQIEYYNTYIY